ncbi:MAG: archaellin/type IV pilin N-terminal domain-containing protein [Candidatus Bathyarchaeia archaeon]
MNIKPLSKSRMGISPILATLLLIVIAVAAIVVTYAWIMTYMSSAGQQAGVRLYEANVRFYNESGVKKIDIDVGNAGTSDTEIIKVYVNGEDKTPSQGFPLKLPAGEIKRITLNYDWTSGATYHFKIVPKTGTSLEFDEEAK